MYGVLGQVVDLRTYRRWLPEKGRRETAEERNWRVAEYNCSLVNHEGIEEERDLLYRKLNDLSVWTSGRLAWVAGTEACRRTGSALFNCTALAINRLEAFKEVIELLSVGAGVGFRILPKDINQLPKFNRDIKLEIIEEPAVDKDRQENTTISRKGDVVEIVIGDSREGWGDGVLYFMKSMTEEVKEIKIDLRNIRPYGMRIKGFGGKASGPGPYKELLKEIHKIITEESERCGEREVRLKAINVGDIVNRMGETIKAGNTRRCLPKGSKVHTPKGLIKIEEIEVGDYVQTPIGYRKVTGKFEQGVQEVSLVKIGEQLFSATDNHRMAVDREGQVEWKELGELNPGDMLYRVPHWSYDYDVIENVDERVVYQGLVYKYEEETYDIEVEEAGCFYCEGILVHNSAEIMLFSPEEEDCIKAKRGLWSDEKLKGKRYRTNSNNSVLLEEKPSKEELRKYFENIRYEGEPGFVNVTAAKRRRREAALQWRKGEDISKYVDNGGVTNPCLGEGTKVLTREGHFNIEDLVGKEVWIYDGVEWVKVNTFRVTGRWQKLYNLKLSTGVTIQATWNHTFILENGDRKSLGELEVGDRLKEYEPTLSKTEVVSIEYSHVADKVYCCKSPNTGMFALSCNLIVGNCAEILLSTGLEGDSGSVCNLTSLPLPVYVKEGKIDYEGLKEGIELITRVGVRQTFVTLPYPKWDETQKAERLLGVNLCGWWDLYDEMGWAVDSEESIEFRKWCRRIANEEATRYANFLGIPRPLLVTTCKPDGTYSLLNTISPGIHPSYAPYYIRRIRMATNDALAIAIIKEGKVRWYPENTELDVVKEGGDIWKKIEWWDSLSKEEKEKKLELFKTVVFEYPVKTRARRSMKDIGAIEQLKNYLLTVRHYADHNASVTISVGEEEWEEVIDFVYENWEEIIAVSFLPKMADNIYPLLPYQEITKEEYEKRAGDFSIDEELLAELERKLEDPDDVKLEQSCATGACPVR